jgi:translation initiation factor 2B subunit (eIF-2B alpha/beta/delta family)
MNKTIYRLVVLAISLAIGCSDTKPYEKPSHFDSQITDLQSRLEKAELRALVAETALKSLKDRIKREQKEMTEVEARQAVIDELNKIHEK